MRKLDLLNSLLHRFNFEVIRYNKGTSGLLRRKAILEKYAIDLIVDVGANTGIFGREVRRSGYDGRIVSFEPLTNAFKTLTKNIKNDNKWRVYNYALGAENGIQQINISANSHSSSILEILDAHTVAERTASYIGKEEIRICTLDSIFAEVKGAAKEIFLKIDTQGFELNVLNGAIESLKNISTIQLELSLHPLYVGQPLYNDLMSFLSSYDYTLIDVEPGFADPKNGVLLQFDGIFRKMNIE